MNSRNVKKIPVDKNFSDLCYACRTGDVENADRLISTGVNVNQVDRFDNSPLFLASLCGHEEVVKLLLERGAICDRDRHEGARCIYGALTDSIRDILLRYDISKAFDMNQPFATHISSLLRDDELKTCDISLSNEHRFLFAHKFMLFARSPILAESISQTSQSAVYKDISELPANILNILLKFIYLIPILHEIQSQDYEKLIKIANKLHLKLLSEFLNKIRHMKDPTEKSSLMIAYQYKFTELARTQLRNFVKNEIINNYTEIDSISDSWDLSISKMMLNAPFPDIFLTIENTKGLRRIYPCNIAMLSRAEFFKELIVSNFKERLIFEGEKKSRQNVLFVELPICDFKVAEILILYIYYDMSDIPWEYAIDIIKLADYILADRLKNIAAAVITQSPEILEVNSIFDILELGWETGVERLEQHAAKYIARNLSLFSTSVELKNAILTSSKRISTREETDTIELVADIRFYLMEKYDLEPEDLPLFENTDDMEFLRSIHLLDYKADISLIDNILKELDLAI